MVDIQEPNAKEIDKDSPKPKRRSCLWITVVIIIFAILSSIAAKLIYLANYQNSLATTAKTPTEASTIADVSTGIPSQKTTKGTATGNQSQSSNQTSGQEPSQEESTTTQADNALLDYFIETAVYDVGGREMFITRWSSQNISVGVGEGEFTQSLNDCLSGFINDFNSLSSSVKLTRNDTVALGIPNIKIYYWEDSDFKQKAGSNALYGLTQWNHKDDKSLQRSMLFLSKAVMDADEGVRCQVLRHEMMHSIGFWGHSNKFFEGIMALPKTRYIYPEEDKSLVRMLYNSGIPIGSNADSARDFSRNNPGW